LQLSVTFVGMFLRVKFAIVGMKVYEEPNYDDCRILPVWPPVVQH